jgi:hypothetical protein
LTRWLLLIILCIAGPASIAPAAGPLLSPDSEETSDPGGVLGSLFGNKRVARGKGDLLETVPLERLTPQAQQTIREIADKPTLYRRLPTQAIRCDEQMFLFLARRPETIIGIWDLMGITNVEAKRTGPYEMEAVDGCGTTCDVNLLYGDRNLHVYVADGVYDGKYAQKPITGRGIFVLKSTYAVAEDGGTTVHGSLDCYVKLNHLGVDLLARSLGGLIGKSADHNFIETARFISQISQACKSNPGSMLEMADQLPQVDATTKRQFARVISSVADRHLADAGRTAGVIRSSGIQTTQK